MTKTEIRESIDKLSLKKGDIILCRNLDPFNMDDLFASSQGVGEKGLIVFLHGNESIEALDEKDMLTAGWKRE